MKFALLMVLGMISQQAFSNCYKLELNGNSRRVPSEVMKELPKEICINNLHFRNDETMVVDSKIDGAYKSATYNVVTERLDDGYLATLSLINEAIIPDYTTISVQRLTINLESIVYPCPDELEADAPKFKSIKASYYYLADQYHSREDDAVEFVFGEYK